MTSNILFTNIQITVYKNIDNCLQKYRQLFTNIQTTVYKYLDNRLQIYKQLFTNQMMIMAALSQLLHNITTWKRVM